MSLLKALNIPVSHPPSLNFQRYNVCSQEANKLVTREQRSLCLAYVCARFFKKTCFFCIGEKAESDMGFHQQGLIWYVFCPRGLTFRASLSVSPSSGHSLIQTTKVENQAQTQEQQVRKRRDVFFFHALASVS